MRLPPSYAAAGPAIATTTANAPDISTLHYGGFWLSKKKGGYDENWSSLIGIITAIVGNVLISFALNMQRYAHIRLDREMQAKERERKRRIASGTSIARVGEEHDGKSKYHPPRSNRDEASESDPLIPTRDGGDSDDGLQEEAYKQKSYLKSPYWWAGIILMTVGEAGNFLAYGFAPASIVSPLGVVALISNCIIAPFMLKEPFRKRDALGVIIAVGGAVTVVLSASDNNPKLGPGEIWKLITTWEFETYLGVTVGVIAVLMVASNRYGEKNILIDLGLVGLFGMLNLSISYEDELMRTQVATRLFRPKAWLLSYHTLSGASSHSQSSTSCFSFWSARPSCRSSTSTAHSSASTLHRSFPSSSSCLRSPSFLDPLFCTATSNVHLAMTQANSLVVAP